MKPILCEVSVSASAEEVYALIAEEKDSIFLDSAINPEGMGRYSFIARDPFLVFTSKGSIFSLRSKEGTITQEGNPFAKLKELLGQYPMEKVAGYPPLMGGVIGYYGYDMGYLLEDIPRNTVDDSATPDCCLGFYDTVLIFDHEQDKCYIVGTGFPERGEEKRKQYAEHRIHEWKERLGRARPLAIPLQPIPQGECTANFTKESYCHMLQRAIDYIKSGDIFQVNLSQRFSAKLTVLPFALYRYLRYSNPAPFAAYLNFPEVIVASASPERYLLLQDKTVETRPIKGTRPRGRDEEEDIKLGAELLASEKDNAELVMIIDLERNDLGRVCEYGSVRVPDLIRLEKYATVFHLVSTVTGHLVPGKDIIDAILASFPGGSITGAPKVRAMEIISDSEPVERGIYTGSIGYIDFNGDADLNIIIRTFIIKDEEVHFQVGGGIVADSVPEEEYQETLDKGRALLRALGYKA